MLQRRDTLPPWMTTEVKVSREHARSHRRGWDYPLHLGVTEAGEGEDGRMKSAIGIGALLMDGLGDTIRVSLTEDPEFELNPCADLAEVRSTRSGVRREV